MAVRGLTTRQRRFIEVYNGNATEAARIAGYEGDDNTLGVTGHELLRNPKIKAEIDKREEANLKSLIATREERQKFWTEVMKAQEQDMKDRLRASELLGKSEADFVEKVEHSGKLTLAELVAGSYRNEKKEK